MINITAASNIIGRNVVDRQWRELGDVDYLMMDMQGGNVRYALIGEGGFLGMGEDLIPVPWRALEFSPQTLRLNKSLAELRSVPRYSADRLFELTEPEIERRIVDYYLTTTPGQAQQGAQRQQQARREQRRQGQQGTQQQQTSTVKPFVLVDRDLVTLLTPPALATAQQIRGVEVVGSMGEEMGEIDEIMIDPDHGQIAYVLLERGGFLGFGEEWIPVPFEALQMSGDNFMLTRTEAQLRRMPQLPREDFPTQVSAEHLRQLYAEYNVTPYWERAWQTAGQAGQQGVSIAATVQDKDPQQGTLTLQTTTGSTVDLQVSPQLLSTLQTGDRVEVTIRQSPKGQQSGMQRTTPSPALQQQ
jgi:sporulation protein YlmC with PRC-barrel domain